MGLGGSMTSDARIRTVSLVAYLAILVAVQAWCISTGLALDNKAIWFVGGIISLLFGSRLINPHFTPPADSLTNAVAALLAILPAIRSVPSWTPDAWVLGSAVGASAFIAIASLLVLFFRAAPGEEQRLVWRLCERAVKGLGSPNIIFTVLIIVAAWLFHRDQPSEIFAILTTLVIVVIIKPLESIADYIAAFLSGPARLRGEDVVGTVAAHQSPGIVLVRQVEPKTIARGTPMVVSDQHGPNLLGVALNYVGRDEGNLLRVLTAPLPGTLASLAGRLPAKSLDGIAVSISVPPEEVAQIPTLLWIGRLCGIVDSDTSTEYLQFEVIHDSGLAEGSLIEARIGDERQVIYQVVDGITREEVVQQKNKYGYARAKARKIGTWDDEARRFCPVPWMPRMNAPVFLLENEGDGVAQGDCIGHFPATPYGVRLDPSECVTHNTAILGILGVGKSYLSIELVERMIAQGIKVVCLDLTNQYEQLLADFLDPVYEQAKRDALLASGQGGQPHQNRELGGSRNTFKRAVLFHMRQFLAAGDDHFLWVLNPAQFRVTKQVSGMFQGNAELAHLTAAEITAIFSEAALIVCQELGMTDEARLCLSFRALSRNGCGLCGEQGAATGAGCHVGQRPPDRGSCTNEVRKRTRLTPAPAAPKRLHK